MSGVIDFPRPSRLERDVFSDVLSSITNPRLRIYCTEQIRCARTQEELSAAIRLVEEIARGVMERHLPNGTRS